VIFPEDIWASLKSSGRRKTDYDIEGCRIYFISWLVQGAAFTLPAIGIFMGCRQSPNNFPSAYPDYLAMHEYGHILQAKDKGLFFYYGIIAPLSLCSAFWSVTTGMMARILKKINSRISLRSYPHHNTWTEWNASRRAKVYFNENNWPEKWFPTRKADGKP